MVVEVVTVVVAVVPLPVVLVPLAGRSGGRRPGLVLGQVLTPILGLWLILGLKLILGLWLGLGWGLWLGSGGVGLRATAGESASGQDEGGGGGQCEEYVAGAGVVRHDLIMVTAHDEVMKTA